jgi:DNA-binding CsgD family transcriptional regulator
MLDDAEIKRMLAAINTIEELTTTAQMRADAAERDGDSQLTGVYDGAAAPRAGPAGQQAWLPYHLSLEFRPLRHVEPPMPTYSLFDAEYIPTLVERRERSAVGILTQRELEVARLLAGGGSRPAIARRLGLSINTIAATTKRIYAKLGVHSRAEFALRMEGA